MPQSYINKKAQLLGAHLSIAKGLDNALYNAKKLECNALQIFTKSPTAWKERLISDKDADCFESAKNETGIKTVISHASYLINIASPEKEKYNMSCNALKHEFIRSGMLGISNVVLHPGSHMGSGCKTGIRLIAEGINELFLATPDLKTMLLLETTAGQGTSIGHRYEHIASIMQQVENKSRLGVCLDTCHIFAAGYDIRTRQAYERTMDAFDSIIGLEHLLLFHLNDSKKKLGSRVDRHEHIGKGFIGIKPFEFIMSDAKFVKIPKIIETPKEKGGKNWDRINIELLKSLICD